MMADYTQVSSTLIAHAHYENGTDFTIVGTSLDVQTFLSGMVFIDHAPTEAVANDPGVTYEVQVNHDPSAGNEFWRTIRSVAAITAIATTEALNGSAASGQRVVPVGSTGAFTIGDYVYIRDDGGAGASEWAQVAEIASGTSFTTVDNLVNSYTTGEDVFVDAVQRWVIDIPSFSGIAHIRVICRNGASAGCNWAVAAYATYATDIE